MGPQESLLETVKRRKRALFGHVTRYDSLPEVILQDTLEGGRGSGRKRKRLMDNVKRVDIPTHERTAYNGLQQKRLVEDLR